MSVVTFPNTRPVLDIAWVRRLLLGRLAAHVPLLAVLGLQVVVSLSLQNAAFQDEALYIHGGRQIFESWIGGPPPDAPYTALFSGMPYIYPVLAGMLDHFAPSASWGLEAARLLSLSFMLFATVAVYAITDQLFERSSAVLAAALFATQGSVLFISHLATYDAMCVAWLALATLLAMRAGSDGGVLAGRFVGVALLLAVATKYVGLLYVPPVLAILILRAYYTHGWRAAVLRVEVAVAVLIVGGLCALLVLDPGTFGAVQATTTSRSIHAMISSRTQVVDMVIELAGILVVIGLAGLIANRHRHILLWIVLWGAALLAPAYHIYENEIVSVHKHIAFGLFFVAPLAGNAVARLGGWTRGLGLIDRRWLASLAVCVLSFSAGTHAVDALYVHGWPDTDPMIHVLMTQVRPGTNHHILAEESEVTVYYLQGILPKGQIDDFYELFQYTTAAGRVLEGAPAYQAAINDGYFDAVVLSYRVDRSMAQAVAKDLKQSPHYKLLATLPFPNMYHAGSYWVWGKA